jgi:hypothetical protein
VLAGRRRWLAVGVWLVCSVVVWNVVFDRRVEKAEERYLNAHSPVAPAAGIRAIMEPAIRHSALVATAWALAVFLPGAVVFLYLPRARGRRPSPRGH